MYEYLHTYVNSSIVSYDRSDWWWPDARNDSWVCDHRSPLPVKWCIDVPLFPMPCAVPFELNMFAPFGLDSNLRWRNTLWSPLRSPQRTSRATLLIVWACDCAFLPVFYCYAQHISRAHKHSHRQLIVCSVIEEEHDVFCIKFFLFFINCFEDWKCTIHAYKSVYINKWRWLK